MPLITYWNKNKSKQEKLLKKVWASSVRPEIEEYFPNKPYKHIKDKASEMGLYKNSKWKLKNDELIRNRSLKNKEVVEMKNTFKKYVGKDKIVGRPIRLNKQTLKTKDSKPYAETVFMGDWHYGAMPCDLDRIKSDLDYCLQKNDYAFLMGDLMEAATRGSVGAGVYEQKLDPQEQLDGVIELLRPLAKRKLILGLLMGNHEFRILKDTGINVSKIIANKLNVPYLEAAVWSLFRVGKETYKVYTLHGSSAARFPHTKLKALVDISHSFNADLMAMGHVHDCIDDMLLVQSVDKSNRQVIEHEKYLVITGGYLRYDRSYAQQKGMSIGKLGAPRVKFFANKHDIHISW